MTIKLEISPYDDVEYINLAADFLSRLAELTVKKQKTKAEQEANCHREIEQSINKTEAPCNEIPLSALPSHSQSLDAPKLQPGEFEYTGKQLSPDLPPCNRYKVTREETADDAFGTPEKSSMELDAAGLPWDKRIHSRDKGKLKNGNWRIKKNIDRSIIASVEAELRNKLGTPIPPKNVEEDTPHMKVHHMQFNGMGAPAAPPVTLQPPPPPATAAVEDPFDALMTMIENAINDNRLTTKHVQDIVMSVPGAINLSNVAKKPEFISPVHAAIAAEIGR